ncbi:Ig-like domain-containing protein [Anoxynatronum buryatiense]|uniref:Ig-like domain (Group 2) n=1 Tax=Anoxynatronum buryatiense TaxID=489973 RepID=A0AA45WY44_9CLOT|nr:Ig-like domain-containing protein [Anoxynatronum buryatiense]SMP65248.1 Ig-like domain (group 2) [Anoxynatronum buryatiense]
MFQRSVRTVLLPVLLMGLLFMGAVTQAAAITPTGIQLNQTSLTLNRGGTTMMEAKVTPDGADTQFLQWTSSNTNVVRVLPEAGGSRARVEGVAQGTAVVTVNLPDGSVGATCQVTVRVPVSGVAVSETTLTLLRGQEVEVTATVQPGDASNKRIRWKIGDEQVLEFTAGSPGSFGSHGTLRVRAVTAGSTSLTVTTEDGSKQAVTEVTVIVPLEAIAFEMKELTLPPGETARVPVIFNPLDTTSRGLRYESADVQVVTVDEEGLITAVGEGSTRVVARSAEEQQIFDSLQITVSDNPEAPSTGVAPGTTGTAESAPGEPDDPGDPDDPEDGGDREPGAPTKGNLLLMTGLAAAAAVVGVAILMIILKKKKEKSGVVSLSEKKPSKQGASPVMAREGASPAEAREEPPANLTRRVEPPVIINSGSRVLVTGLSGEFQGHTLELAKDVLVIGRDPLFAHLVYPGSFEMISRKHVVIEHDGETGICSLRDLSSTGTYLPENHQRLPHDEPVPVKDGQQFYLAVSGELFEIRYDEDHDDPSEA